MGNSILSGTAFAKTPRNSLGTASCLLRVQHEVKRWVRGQERRGIGETRREIRGKAVHGKKREYFPHDGDHNEVSSNSCQGLSRLRRSKDCIPSCYVNKIMSQNIN